MYAGIVLVLAAVAVLAYTFLFSSNGTTTASNQTAQEVSAPAADSQALPNTQQNSSDHSTGNTTDAVQVKAPGKEPAEPATTHSEVVVAAPETQETPLPAHTNTTKPNDKPALMSGPVFFQFYIDYPKGGNHAAQ